jgi:large subunit ribosomal protein L13
MKTYSAKPHEVEAKWYIIDAENKTLGRLAVTIANILTGKIKPEYTPHVDMGDFVVVINSEKIRVTGKKETAKVYYRYTGYPGGLRARTYKELMAVDPTKALEKAVRGMLSHNTLGTHQLSKLKIYAGAEHPHEAQRPVEYIQVEVNK